MANRRTVYPGSPEGTHPSYASPGVSTVECDECGDEITYTHCIDETYRYNGDAVGVGGDGDFCAECWERIEGEPLT